MDKLALILVLCSGLFHVLRDLFVKRAENKQIFLWLYLVAGMLISLPYAWFFLAGETYTWLNVGIVAGSAIIHAFYLISLAETYKVGDLSHVYPIARSAPVLVLIFAVIFLGEKVTVLGALGVLAVTLGVYLINAKAITLAGLLEPIRSIFKERASRYALGVMFLVAVYSIVDKVGVEFFHPISYFFLLQLFTWICLTPYMLLTRDKQLVRQEIKQNKLTLFKAAALDVLSYTLALAALKLAEVSYVVGVRQYSVILAVIIGHKLFQEGFVKIRLMATGVIFVGLLLIGFA